MMQARTLSAALAQFQTALQQTKTNFQETADSARDGERDEAAARRARIRARATAATANFHDQ